MLEAVLGKASSVGKSSSKKQKMVLAASYNNTLFTGIADLQSLSLQPLYCIIIQTLDHARSCSFKKRRVGQTAIDQPWCDKRESCWPEGRWLSKGKPVTLWIYADIVGFSYIKATWRRWEAAIPVVGWSRQCKGAAGLGADWKGNRQGLQGSKDISSQKAKSSSRKQ